MTLTSLAVLIAAPGSSAHAAALAGPHGTMRAARTPLRFAARSGHHGANHFLLRRAGSNLQLLDTDTGAMLREVALARTSGVTIAGANGHVDNTLTLDFSGGPLSVRGPISFSGGHGGYNVLALRGGHFAHEREIARTPHAGLIVLDGTTIHYAQIAPINDTAAALNYTVNGTAAAETINVVKGPVVGVQTTQVNSVGNTFELINFANKTNVRVNGNGGSDTFNLNNPVPAAGLATMTLASSEFQSSTFNVVVSTKPLTLLGGGTDTGNLGVNTAQTITSTVSIEDPEEMKLNVNDSANSASSRFVTITSTTISGLTGSTISAPSTDLASLAISGGSVGNTFVVSGTSAPLTLNTGAGIDSTFVQGVGAGTSIAIHGQGGGDGVALSNAGSLQGILGPVSIDNSGGSTGVVLDGSNETKAATATLSSGPTNDTIAGMTPSTVAIKASDLGSFTLDGGSGGNTFTLTGLTALGAATLNTGTGPDTTNVLPSTSMGPINVNGQNGEDTVHLGDVQQLTGGATVTNGGATTLTVDDGADSTARAVSVGTTAITGLAPMPISFAGVPALTIDGGAPADSFAVTPSTTTAETIVGGGPASATPPGNALDMQLAGTASAALSGTPSAAGAQGEWTFANRSPVKFSHMQSLNPTAVSVGDAAATVNGSGTSPLLFPVSLLAATALPVSATYATADGTATVASGAYQPASGTVFFPAGATSETVVVNALGAPTVRPPQSFVLALLEPVNAQLARSLATGTIFDGFLPTTPGGATPPPGSPSTPTGTVAPTLTHMSQTRSSWRAGTALAAISRSAKRRAPLGTSFSFALNEPATVSLAFTQATPGRRAHGRCVAETHKNRRGRACLLAVTRGTLRIGGHGGADHVSFQGRLSRSATLKPGRYVLRATATSASGQRSAASALSFTIVR